MDFFIGDICTTPQNTTGVCINIHSCQPIVEILKQQKPLSKDIYDYLISLQCGFENKDPKVCCEQVNILCNHYDQHLCSSDIK